MKVEVKAIEMEPSGISDSIWIMKQVIGSKKHLRLL